MLNYQSVKIRGCFVLWAKLMPPDLFGTMMRPPAAIRNFRRKPVVFGKKMRSQMQIAGSRIRQGLATSRPIFHFAMLVPLVTWNEHGGLNSHSNQMVG